jgi:glycosyltransferase involved in cell wall biosynthesis
LDEQNRWIDEHTDRMDEQNRWIDEHTSRLDEQNRWVDEHTGRLDEQAGWIDEHNMRLNALMEQIQTNYKLIQALANNVFPVTEGEGSIYNANGATCILQMVPVLNYGDAIGNETLELKKLLKSEGIRTEIFTDYIDPRLPIDSAKPVEFMPRLQDNDIVIYRFSSGSAMAEKFALLSCKKVIFYHNITPSFYYRDYDRNAERTCSYGEKQVVELAGKVDYCITVSEYNKQQLLSLGYTCPISVVPKLIQFQDYNQTPNQNIWSALQDKLKTIIFVGRVAPNKKLEDVIKCFAYYQGHYETDSRLILVGSYPKDSAYHTHLLQIIEEECAKNVTITGHVPFWDILAYYCRADLFLCMSEHEGFCVPLVEAMYFGIPIIAYDSTAVGETLGGSGILVKEKNALLVAEKMHEVLSDPEKRRQLVEAERNRLSDFSTEHVSEQLLEIFKKIKGVKVK